jgi:transcription initiation factor IIE alpha subunit
MTICLFDMPTGYPGRTKGAHVMAMCFAKMIRLLEQGKYSIQDIADELGLHYMTVSAYLAALHKERAIHIHAWGRDAKGRPCIKIFILGDGLDAKRPTKPRRKVVQEYLERKLRKNHGTCKSASRQPDNQL